VNAAGVLPNTLHVVAPEPQSPARFTAWAEGKKRLAGLRN